MAYNSTLSSQNIESALKTVHEAITIGGGILSLTSESDSSAISDVVGGASGFNDLLTKARAKNVSFGITVDESSTAGVTMASILADKTESKLTISFAYNRAFIKDVITLSDSTFTLEQTVLPLTGNITYHTHDTTYAAQELETDVWDGTTVSTSWNGSGTEEDPFLIQSCADYIYFLTGEIESLIQPSSTSNGNEDPKYIKIVKNLDFNNKEIPLTSPGDNISAFIKYNYILDGNGVVIKNLSIQTTSAESGFYLPCHYLPLSLFGFIHDVNFVKVKWRTSEFSLSSLQSAIIQMLFANIVFDISLEFTESEESSNIIMLPIVFDYISSLYPNCSVNTKKQDYIRERGCFFGINIETSRIPSKNLMVTVACMSEYSFFDMSKYNFSDDLGSDQSNIFALQATYGYKEAWLSTLSQGKFIAADISSQLPSTVIDAKTVSPQYINSQDYISEVNSENPILKLENNYNLPLISLLSTSYNGYVRTQLFNKFKKEVNLKFEMEERDLVVDLFKKIDFARLITSNDTMELGKVYEIGLKDSDFSIDMVQYYLIPILPIETKGSKPKDFSIKTRFNKPVINTLSGITFTAYISKDDLSVFPGAGDDILQVIADGHTDGNKWYIISDYPTNNPMNKIPNG